MPSILRKNSNYDEASKLNEGLVIKDRSFRQQYASLYYVRLHTLRKAILEAAEHQWGSLPEKPRYISKVLDVPSGELCYVIGTVYKDMRLKPNILRDLTEESSIVAPPHVSKYTSPEGDKCSLEDESGRVELTGSVLHRELFVTGTVVAVLGKESASGAFEAVDVCYPGIPPQPTVSLGDPAHPTYVAILSGLNVSEDASNDLKTQLMLEYLTGELGGNQDRSASASISRVIIAGNSLSKKTFGQEDKESTDTSSLRQFDSILEELCSTVDVDLMPGANEPVNIHLPQQALHKLMFTRASTYSTLNCVTNPHWSKINNALFLGTSGQTLDDLGKYMEEPNGLELAQRCLLWRHMAPSAPDTLWCYPFQDHDPFIIESCPHVYYIGNQPSFETHLLTGPEGQQTRVVTVPSFSETGIIVLVNLSTLECSTVQFDADGSIQTHDTTEPMDEPMDETA